MSVSGAAQRNENGRLAEYRAEGFLIDHFWVAKFAVQLDGAVFLIRRLPRSVESINTQSAAEPVAILLSTFCRADRTTEIPRPLIEGPDGQPQKATFISIHLTETLGEPSELFFSASEVQAVCRRMKNSAEQEVFKFAVTPERNFSQFQRKSGMKAAMISSVLASIELPENQAFLKLTIKTMGPASVQPLMVQVAENQWQMRYRNALFEFEQDDNSIIHGWKSDSSGQKDIASLLPQSPLDRYVFDPLNEVWVEPSL